MLGIWEGRAGAGAGAGECVGRSVGGWHGGVGGSHTSQPAARAHPPMPCCPPTSIPHHSGTPPAHPPPHLLVLRGDLVVRLQGGLEKSKGCQLALWPPRHAMVAAEPLQAAVRDAQHVGSLVAGQVEHLSKVPGGRGEGRGGKVGSEGIGEAPASPSKPSDHAPSSEGLRLHAHLRVCDGPALTALVVLQSLQSWPDRRAGCIWVAWRPGCHAQAVRGRPPKWPSEIRQAG